MILYLLRTFIFNHQMNALFVKYFFVYFGPCKQVNILLLEGTRGPVSFRFCYKCPAQCTVQANRMQKTKRKKIFLTKQCMLRAKNLHHQFVKPTCNIAIPFEPIKQS